MSPAAVKITFWLLNYPDIGCWGSIKHLRGYVT